MRGFLFIAFILAGVIGAVIAKKLTITASITGGVLAALIFFGVGWLGIAFMTCFFLLGTLTTSWKKNYKLASGIVKKDDARRNTGQVLANGGVAGVLGALAIVFPQHQLLFLFLIATSFSAATSDTISSELGTVYGRNFYDILSLKRGVRGENGIISIEGTFFGILGSTFIAAIYSAEYGLDQRSIWIVVAGTIGNLADSVLGATLERRNVLGNDAVNLLNTAIAAAVGYFLFSI